MSLVHQAADALAREIAELGSLKRDFERRRATGAAAPLPGNANFLADGRVLCRERTRGDSRYVYGADGFHLWVSANGYLHANQGRHFLFLPTHSGHEPSVAFFAGVRQADDRFSPLALLPVPFLAQAESAVEDRFTVIGHDATYFVASTPELAGVVRVFLDQSAPLYPQIVFSVSLENRTEQTLDVYLSGYFNPLCRNQFFETSEDCWFKRSESAAAGDVRRLPPFRVTVHEDMSRCESITHTLAVRRALTLPGEPAELGATTQVCTARRGYTGSPRRGLGDAGFLTTGAFAEPIPLTVFNDNAIAGDLHRFRLPRGSAARCEYALALCASPDLADAPFDAADADARHAQVQRGIMEKPHDLRCTVRGCSLDGVADDTLNHFLIYLRQQVEVCAQTRGFMQPAPRSLIGVRDVCQAIEGQLYDQPAAARRRLVEVLGYVLADGRCPRQYALPVNGTDSVADLREFIDQGSWLVSVVHTYCAATGDLSLLDERLAYQRIHPHQADMLTPADATDSGLEHLLRVMDYLERQRDPRTGLLRALYGDWNDALDGLGISADPQQAFGTGVSVMASLHYYRNCAELIALLERHPGDHAARIAHLRQVRRGLRDGLLAHAVVRENGARRVLHGWGDGRSYLVGSFRDCDGRARDGLAATAFWVLCGMLPEDPGLRSDLVAAFDRLDAPFGLRTFAPGFAPGTRGVGRIPNLPIGTAENGATYVHATAFGIMALFAMNEPQRAWAQIHKILPFAPHQQGISHSPFVMPNSYVHNPELNLTGQNMNDWQTGSSNALLKALIWHVAGYQPGLDALRITPATWSPLSGFTLAARAHSRPIRIIQRREAGDRRRMLLNDETLPVAPLDGLGIPGAVIPYERLSPTTENVIRVIDPE